MAVKGSSFEDIQAQANQLLRVWAENPKLALGDLTKGQFSDTVAAFTSARTEVDDLRNQLTRAINDLNAKAAEILAITVRARSVARGQFGPNSTQYEQLGGTRTSDRKPRTKKKPPKS
jgi:hypothetical protein